MSLKKNMNMFYMGAVKIHVVFDVDCKLKPTFSLAQQKRTIATSFQRSHPDIKVEVEVHCHSLGSAVLKILKQGTNRLLPEFHLTGPLLENDRETIEIFEKIKSDLLKPNDSDKKTYFETVLVYGFGFGGAIVNAVSRMISYREGPFGKNFPQLQMASFGSVNLVMPPIVVARLGPKLEGYNEVGRHTLVNYIAKEDIVLSVNNFNRYYSHLMETFPSEHNSDQVRHLKDKSGKSLIMYVPVKTNKDLPPSVQPICIKHCNPRRFFSSSDWHVHFAYGRLFYALLNGKTVLINDLPDILPNSEEAIGPNLSSIPSIIEDSHKKGDTSNKYLEEMLKNGIFNGILPSNMNLHELYKEAIRRAISSLNNAKTNGVIKPDKYNDAVKTLTELSEKECNGEDCQKDIETINSIHAHNKTRFRKIWRRLFSKKADRVVGGKYNSTRKHRKMGSSKKRR